MKDVMYEEPGCASTPDVRTIRVAAADLNGQARGKRIPARFADNVIRNGTRFPMSVLNLDIWGEDIEDSPLVFEMGDADGILRPTERGFMPMPWLEAPTALLPIWMFRENGQPYEGDPRHALRAVVDRYKARGLTPVVAMELEFFLIDDSGKTLQVPPSPGRASGARRRRRCRSGRSMPSTPSSPIFTTPARRWTFPPTPPSAKPDWASSKST
jgi:glutamine synthetase